MDVYKGDIFYTVRTLDFTNDGYTPESTGPDSSGWITVTEHKISQSFDLTRVMFSRGNVTERK